MEPIDTTFDFRTDAGSRDPDTHSPTLRRYHRLLWGKPLPNGTAFDLSETKSAYLHHNSDLGEFFLSSDGAASSMPARPALQPFVDQFSEAENDAFWTITYTVGGFMVFPSNKVNGKQTINQARGWNRSISDRFDLTLEAIRRHYSGLDSPLAFTLSSYADFFALFGDFRGYVSHFLLQDLVEADFSTVRFFMPFNDFKSPAVPNDIDTYREYRRRAIAFIAERNARIDEFVRTALT